MNGRAMGVCSAKKGYLPTFWGRIFAVLLGVLSLGVSYAEDIVSPTLEPQTEDGAVHRELRSAEHDVNSLKERVFRSKATLQLLRELLVEAEMSGSRITIEHENKMGPIYDLEGVEYILDGKTILSRMDTKGSLNAERQFLVFEQPLAPGEHNLQINFLLRGDGLGVFSYVKDYSFRIQSTYSFTVEEERQTVVKVVVDEHNQPWKSFVERPYVRYVETSDGKERSE